MILLFGSLLKPYPITDQAEKQFLWYLLMLEEDNPILGIVFPDNLNNLTNSLGLGALILFFYF